MFGLSKVATAQNVDLSVEGMLEAMRQLGEPTLTIVTGNWWCYFNYTHGAVHIKIEASGDRSKMTLYEQVEGCYANVKRTVEALQNR